MAMYRPYIVDTGLVSITATGLTPLLYIAPTSTNDVNIIAVACSVEVSGSAPTAVSNSDWFFSVNTVTGTKGGGGAVVPSIIGPSSLAANTVFSSAASAAITGLTQSTERYGHAVPFSAGSFSDGAWENTGREINLAASSTSAVYRSVPSGPGAGAGWYARAILWIAE